MYASHSGQMICANLLISNGARVDMRSGHGGLTSLMIACDEGQYSCAGLLLSTGANVNLKSSLGQWSPLMFASRNGCAQTVQLLCDNKAHVNATNALGDTAISIAAKCGNTQCVRILLDFGADTNIQNVHGNTALHLASCFQNSFEIVKQLTQCGAKINLQNKDNLSPLMIASGVGHRDTVEHLCSMGANLTQRDKNGNTAAMLAARAGHSWSLEVLLKLGINPNDVNYNKESALGMACQSQHFDCQPLLILWGANINCQKNGAKMTPLMWAAKYGAVGMVKFLCSFGAELGLENAEGKTALTVALETNQGQCISVLLNFLQKCYEDIELTEEAKKRGIEQAKLLCSYLMKACEEGNADLAEWLCSCLSDQDLKFTIEEMRSAQDIARNKGYYRCANIIEKYKIESNLDIAVDPTIKIFPTGLPHIPPLMNGYSPGTNAWGPFSNQLMVVNNTKFLPLIPGDQIPTPPYQSQDGQINFGLPFFDQILNMQNGGATESLTLQKRTTGVELQASAAEFVPTKTKTRNCYKIGEHELIDNEPWTIKHADITEDKSDNTKRGELQASAAEFISPKRETSSPSTHIKPFIPKGKEGSPENKSDTMDPALTATKQELQNLPTTTLTGTHRNPETNQGGTNNDVAALSRQETSDLQNEKKTVHRGSVVRPATLNPMGLGLHQQTKNICADTTITSKDPVTPEFRNSNGRKGEKARKELNKLAGDKHLNVHGLVFMSDSQIFGATNNSEILGNNTFPNQSSQRVNPRKFNFIPNTNTHISSNGTSHSDNTPESETVVKSLLNDNYDEEFPVLLSPKPRSCQSTYLTVDVIDIGPNTVSNGQPVDETKVTDEQIGFLVADIESTNIDRIAITYLGFKRQQLTQYHEKELFHRDPFLTKFDILDGWRNMNPNVNQRKVRVTNEFLLTTSQWFNENDRCLFME